MAEIDCRHFNGYKPCGKSEECTLTCAHYARVQERILIVHLEALGSVLRSTSLLPSIKRKYPQSHITFLTKTPALLENIAQIDRVLTLSQEDLLKLGALRFDIALVLDKSLIAEGLLKLTRVDHVFGFRSDPVGGAIIPANPEARELWEMGLDNHKKFFTNKKSEQQLTHEALALGAYEHDRYVIELSEDEQARVRRKRRLWGRSPIVGINTGCSPVIPYKKLTHQNHLELIRLLRANPEFATSPIVLLGGREDRERNERLAGAMPDLILSPTDLGLRDGLTSVGACDIVITGDSLGMHMAIGLGKWVVAWFGPTVAAEIDLYGRGRKILSSAPCSPCWKRVCHQPKMCYDQVDLGQVVLAAQEGLPWLTSSSKPHSPEMSFSPSPF